MSNSIPDKCSVRFEIRTLSMDYYDHVADRLKKCAEAAALATGCTIRIDLPMPICSSMKHSKALSDSFRDILKINDISEAETAPQPIATDMGDVSQKIPSLHPFWKITEGSEMLHTADFLEATNKPYAWDQMKAAAEILAELGEKVMTDPELLKQLRKEKEALC